MPTFLERVNLTPVSAELLGDVIEMHAAMPTNDRPVFEVRAVAFMRTASALSTAAGGRHPSPDSRADISSAARAWTVSADAGLAEARWRVDDRDPILCLLTARPPTLSRRR